MNLKTALAGAIVALGLLAAPASAATYNIAFTQNGVGDSGPDWFGTFEAPDAGGQITSFSATIAGITYDYIETSGFWATFWPIYDATNNLIRAASGFPQVTTDPVANGVAVILFSGDARRLFSLSSCGFLGCGGSPYSGSYAITPSEVPLPAALPLLAAGLGGLGIAGWRRKKVAQKAA